MATDKRDFEEFSVEDNMHIAINLKDFKAVVAHAETANATIMALYTRPCKPLQLAYEFEGVHAEFTIMTRGEVNDEDEPTSSRATMPQLSRQTPAPAPISVSRTNGSRTSTPSQMPPPPSRSRSIRPLNGSSTQEHLSHQTATDQPSKPSTATMDFDSLFVPADDDRQWDEMDDQQEPQDILGWDATGNQVRVISGLVEVLCADTIQDTFEGTLRDVEPNFQKPTESRDQSAFDDMGIPPTQRISQVRAPFSVFGLRILAGLTI